MNGSGRIFPRLLPRVRQGERPRADKQNLIVDALNRSVEGIRARPEQRADSGRVILAAELRRFLIKEIKGDYLLCVAWDGAEESERQTPVAKPWYLRRSLESHHIFTFTYPSTTQRVANDGSDTETQILVPSYQVDDEIVGMKGINGGVGVRTVTGGRIDWIDMNETGRMWARDPDA